jgi:hypothetical protein
MLQDPGTGRGPAAEYGANVNIAKEYGGPTYPAQEYYPDQSQEHGYGHRDDGNDHAQEPDAPPEPDATARLWQESQKDE